MGKKCFHVYKSSAGSGKTFTLVKEYLKIVLKNPGKMSQILAITFTNAAAAEMKSRIISKLGELAALADNPNDLENRAFLNQILREYAKEGTPHPPEDQLLKNAGIVLTEILHKYSDFSVSTIDSFVHRIVRTFAFDLRIPLNFEVELESEQLLSKAVDLLISRTGSDEKLTELLIRFILLQADEEESLQIENSIGHLAKTLMDEDSIQFTKKLKELSLDEFLKIQEKIINKIRKFEQNARKKASEALKLIHSKKLKAKDFYQGKKGIYAYFKNLSEGLIPTKITANTYVFASLEEDKWYGGKAGPSEKANIDSIKDSLRQYYFEIINGSNDHLQFYHLLRAVNQNLFPLGVLNEVQRMLDEIKTENALLHISDFNRKISEIVANQPVPFIYERIGERYLHYMIDEFQDTSVLQWQNLLPLVENGLASGNLSLVVGDGKQAIFRWRNGDVEQFVSLPDLPQGLQSSNKDQWQQSITRNYHEQSLDTNFRSKKVIVHFNNCFFNEAKKYLSERMQKIYAQVSQKFPKNAEGGYVEVCFLDKEGDYQDLSFLKIKETIERLLEAGHPYSDITILCRSNIRGSQVARYLLRNQVPVISSESLLLNQSEEVIFYLATLKLIQNRHDSVAAIEWLGYLITNGWLTTTNNLHQALSQAGLFPLPPGKPEIDWHDILAKILKKNQISFSFSDLSFLNLNDICQCITRSFFTLGEPNPFVTFFLNAVYEYSEKNSLSIADFLEWWGESGDKFSLVVPRGLNAAQVMTIHKSKGLKFPVVIFPFADLKPSKPTRNGIWVNPEEQDLKGLKAVWLKLNKKTLQNTPYFGLYEDEMERTMLDLLNLAYVAFTRAEHKLFVISKEPPELKTDSRPSLPQMLRAFLAGEQEKEANCFAFGTFEKVVPEKASVTEKDSPFQKVLSRSWTVALKMRSNQEERGIASADRRERGKLLHRVLEQITTIEDVGPVLARMRAEGEIDSVIEEEWLSKISELLNLSDLAPCFSPEANIKTEPGLFDEHGNFYRPDRVVFFDDHTVVIEYKTGREYSDHNKQISHYASLLEKMGYPAVKKMLLYLDEYRLKIV